MLECSNVTKIILRYGAIVSTWGIQVIRYNSAFYTAPCILSICCHLLDLKRLDHMVHE